MCHEYVPKVPNYKYTKADYALVARDQHTSQVPHGASSLCCMAIAYETHEGYLENLRENHKLRTPPPVLTRAYLLGTQKPTHTQLVPVVRL